MVCLMKEMNVDVPVPQPVLDHSLLTEQQTCFAVALRLRAGDGVLGLASSIAPALGRESLVVVLAKVKAKLLPGIEVARGGDGSAAGTLALPVANVLPEGAGTLNGGLVDLLVLPDVVDGAVASDSADLLALGRTGAVVGVLLDVVLDQGVGGPAIDGDEDGTSLGGGGALEVDLPVGSGPPSLADDEVTSARELDRVSIVGWAELNIAAGLVVLVVVLATDELISSELEVRSIGHRGSEGAGSG